MRVIHATIPVPPAQVGQTEWAEDHTLEGIEPALGNPAADGYVLTSTAAGVRSWAAGTPGPTGPALQLPVGYVWISTSSTNPATVLGYGTWTAFAAGQVLVGYAAADPDFGTAGASVGAKTKAISAHSGTAVADHAAHTHSVTSNVTVDNHASHTHTYTDVPNHVHVQTAGTGATGNFSSSVVDTSSGGTGGSIATTTCANSTLNPTGGVATGTTAGPNATLTHTVTNNAVTSGNPSATLTHSVTQPSAHTDLNVIQPSLVVYMFERTA